MTLPSGTTLYYDGECGFCSRVVQFTLSHERRRTLLFAPLQGPTASAMLADRPELRRVDSVILRIPPAESHPERVLVRTRAVVALLRYIGGPWAVLAAIGRLVPSALGDIVYDFVARNRKRIAPMTDTCLLPSPEQRRRFLD